MRLFQVCRSLHMSAETVVLAAIDTGLPISDRLLDCDINAKVSDDLFEATARELLGEEKGLKAVQEAKQRTADAKQRRLDQKRAREEEAERLKEVIEKRSQPPFTTHTPWVIRFAEPETKPAPRRQRGEIASVHVGVPRDIADDILWVGRSYRTNELSHVEGGSDVIVVYSDGDVLGYDWVKYPSRYVKTFYLKKISYEEDYFDSFEYEVRLDMSKQDISRLYLKTSDSGPRTDYSLYQEVWDREKHENMPWEEVEQYDISHRRY